MMSLCRGSRHLSSTLINTAINVPDYLKILEAKAKTIKGVIGLPAAVAKSIMDDTTAAHDGAVGDVAPKVTPRTFSMRNTLTNTTAVNTDATCSGAGTVDPTCLVVLVGWAMAKQKHIAKYSKVYNNLGFPTLSLTPTIFDTITLTSYEKYSGSVLNALNSSYKGSVLLHFFSSSAAIILPSFTEMGERLSNISLKGMVFDCGPILNVRESGMAAAKVLYEQGVMNRLTYHASIAYGIIMEKLDGSQAIAKMTEALQQPILSSIPQLYLYSDKDVVILQEKIKTVIEEQRALGRRVEEVLFNGAPHVKLLQSEPGKYIQRISSFLQELK